MVTHSLRILALAGFAAVLAGGWLVFPEAALAQNRMGAGFDDVDNGGPPPPPPDTGEVKGLVEHIVEDVTPIGDIYCDFRDLCGFIWEWATTPFLEGVIRMGAELEGTPVPVPPANPGPVTPVTPVPVPAATPTPPADGEAGGNAGAPRPVWGPTPDPVWGPPSGDPGRTGVYITLDGEVLDLYEILGLGDPSEENDEAAPAGEGDEAESVGANTHDSAWMEDLDAMTAGLMPGAGVADPSALVDMIADDDDAILAVAWTGNDGLAMGERDRMEAVRDAIAVGTPGPMGTADAAICEPGAVAAPGPGLVLMAGPSEFSE